MLEDDLESADAIMRLAFGTASRPSRPGEHVRRQGHGAHAVPGSPGLRMGRRARRRRRRLGVRRALGLVRILRAAVGPPGPLGPRHRRPTAPARPRLVHGLGHPAGRALHLRGESQASRPLPEARLLARRADARDDEGGRSRSQGEYALFSDERGSGEERLLEEARRVDRPDLSGTRPRARDPRRARPGARRHRSAARRGDAGGNGRVPPWSGKRGGR